MEELIRSEIRQFVLKSPANRFPDSDKPFFDAPLIGFARADDPLFADYKRIIGNFHLTPDEIMQTMLGYRPLFWRVGHLLGAAYLRSHPAKQPPTDKDTIFGMGPDPRTWRGLQQPVAAPPYQLSHITRLSGNFAAAFRSLANGR